MIAIGSDHAGIELKMQLKSLLANQKWLDLGTESPSSVDYPDFAKKVCDAVASGQAQFGILICGSGIGMSISANRNPKIRAALLHDTVSARLTREHNDANVVCLGARFVAAPLAAEIVRTFLETPFSGDERHLKRIRKLGESK